MKLLLLLALPSVAQHVQLQTAFRDASALAAPKVSAVPGCRPEVPGGPRLTSRDFKWSYTLPELLRRFDEVYPSGDKRLPMRAFWNDAQSRYELPYPPERGGNIPLSGRFIASITRHVEQALAAGYVDAVFFPDMGHSHILIPEPLYDAHYAKFPVSAYNRMHEEMFDDPRVEVLYHTAEQLETRKPDGSLVDDARTRFRYETRNIVGGIGTSGPLKVLSNPASQANTVAEVPGYRWWGGGFNISANADGCFAYSANGRTLRFDLSMFDLAPPPGEFSVQSDGEPAIPVLTSGQCRSLAAHRP